MRINQFIANASANSRRQADELIKSSAVTINGQIATLGMTVKRGDVVKLKDDILTLRSTKTLIMLNKPVGYVCSRSGQGSKTVYDLLPKELSHLKPVGRLDKNSTGLLLLTDDGPMANQLTHPSFGKLKIYDIKLNKRLSHNQLKKLVDQGIELSDGISRFKLNKISLADNTWRAELGEGRNRQIRRTFNILGYEVISLKRIKFGPYSLGNLALGKWQKIASTEKNTLA